MLLRDDTGKKIRLLICVVFIRALLHGLMGEKVRL